MGTELAVQRTEVATQRDVDISLLCRSFGHAWDPCPVPEDAARYQRHSTIALRCARCTTLRIDHWDARGFVGARSYRYPDSYKELGADIHDHQRSDETSQRAAKRLLLHEMQTARDWGARRRLVAN